MPATAEILDQNAIARAIARISYEIIEKNRGTQDVCVIGIYTRGVYLAKRIANKISELEGKEIPIGYLDITPYRDDLTDIQKVEDRTQIDFDMKDKKIILVDDVIFTGRSVRAAIDAIMSRGRPTNIQLAALIDRGHRELPIRPDFIGKNVPTSREEKVVVEMRESDGHDHVVIIKQTEEEE